LLGSIILLSTVPVLPVDGLCAVTLASPTLVSSVANVNTSW